MITGVQEKSYQPLINNNKLNHKTKTSLKISQWNGLSIQNETKLNFLRSLPGDIITVQEIWRHSKNVKSIGNILEISEREFKRGGGSATLSNNDKIIVIERVQLNKDSHAVKIRYENVYAWIANIYLNKGTFSKLQKLFGKLQNTIPPNEWKILCCIGDFNINVTRNSSEKELLTKLCKLMGLRLISPTNPTRGTSTIDYILIGDKIIASEDSKAKGPSDHIALTWQLQIEANEKKRPIKIPSKVTAEEISLALINNNKITKADDFISHFGQLAKLKKRELMKIIKPIPRKTNKLMERLLNIQEPEEITNTINEHWREYWNETESLRFSQESAVAYKNLKNILKYHLFEKRDGGIINSIKKEDGTIEQHPEKVSDLLLQTMEEIQVDNKWKWLEQKEFPQLPKLTKSQLEVVMLQLSSTKAIAFDGLSNLLFSKKKEKDIDSDSDEYNPKLENTKKKNKKKEEKKSNLEKTAEKLTDLWSLPLHSFPELEETWNTRLVPLNKVFPEVPTRKEMRPIAVQSPMVKLLEARFLPDLQTYLNKKLDRSQIGFIQKMGIQVNLVRALERISLRTKQKKEAYGLFIDFSNAYNSIPHELLFNKLRSKNVLKEEEINFLEQLYARYNLRVGNKTLRSNKGVAQGSVISPALFNIFIEDLSEELKSKANIDLEDLLYYADDLLTLCDSIEQVKTAINIITDWSQRNGMLLNKKKSGIVIFTRRRANKISLMKLLKDEKNPKKDNKWTPTQIEIEGVPICEKYKYLGTILTPKLTCGEQIAFIRRKSAYIFVKLYPYLQNASADARRDMWQTMIRPLFDATFVLLEYEPSKTQKENVQRLWRKTFKQFLMISKRINTKLILEMAGSDIEKTAENLVSECKKQWENRKRGEDVAKKTKLRKQVNLLRAVPNTWCKLLNTQVAPCPKCKKPDIIGSPWHMKTSHGIELKDVQDIWKEDICEVTKLDKTKITRNRIRKKITPILQTHLDLLERI